MTNDSVTGSALGDDTLAAQKDLADKWWYDWKDSWPSLSQSDQAQALADLTRRLLEVAGDATVTHVPGWDLISFDPSSGSHIDPDPTTDGSTAFVRPMPALAQQVDGGGATVALWLKTGPGPNDWINVMGGGGASAGLVFSDPSDTVAKTLLEKLSNGAHVTMSVVVVGGVRTVQIAVTWPTPGDIGAATTGDLATVASAVSTLSALAGLVKADSTDTVPNDLIDKVLAGAHITFSLDTTGGVHKVKAAVTWPTIGDLGGVASSAVSATPSAGIIPQAGSDGKLAAAFIPPIGGGTVSRHLAIPASCQIAWEFTEASTPWHNQGNGSALDLAFGAKHASKTSMLWGPGMSYSYTDGSGATDCATAATAVGEFSLLTIELWTRQLSCPPVSPVGGTSMMITKAYGSGWSSPYGVFISFILATGQFQVGWPKSTSVLDSFNSDVGWVTSGAWCYVALTFDGTYMRLYFNGCLIGQSNSTALVWSNGSTHGKWIIGNNGAGNQAYIGNWQAARIHNSVLSAGTILANAQTTLLFGY